MHHRVSKQTNLNVFWWVVEIQPAIHQSHLGCLWILVPPCRYDMRRLSIADSPKTKEALPNHTPGPTPCVIPLSVMCLPLHWKKKQLPVETKGSSPWDHACAPYPLFFTDNNKNETTLNFQMDIFRVSAVNKHSSFTINNPIITPTSSSTNSPCVQATSICTSI